MQYLIEYERGDDTWGDHYDTDWKTYTHILSTLEEVKEWCANFLSEEIIHDADKKINRSISCSPCRRSITAIYPIEDDIYDGMNLKDEINCKAQAIADISIDKFKEERRQYDLKEKIKREGKEKTEYLKLKEKFGDKAIQSENNI